MHWHFNKDLKMALVPFPRIACAISTKIQFFFSRRPPPPKSVKVNLNFVLKLGHEEKIFFA
jgi:hypothetical protein